MTRPSYDRSEDRDERKPIARLSPTARDADLANAILQAQRTAGNRAVARAIQGRTAGPVMQRKLDFWGQVSKFFTGSYTITRGGETIRVKDEKEEAEATRIIAELKAVYGVEISSLKSVEGIKKHYAQAPKAVLGAVKTGIWEFRELAALARALKHFAPILGERRSFSPRWEHRQEVVSAGKAPQSITGNVATASFDPATLGEYFKENQSLAMFEAGENSTENFAGDNPKTLEATAVHEIAHGLMGYALVDFATATGYWRDLLTKSGKAGAEAPPTAYGDVNAHEDLSESVMLYFVDPKRLLGGDGSADGLPGNPCPQRHALISQLVTAWALQSGALELPPTDAAAGTA